MTASSFIRRFTGNEAQARTLVAQRAAAFEARIGGERGMVIGDRVVTACAAHQGGLGVDEGGIAPGLLGVGDGVQGDRGLTGGLRTVDFDDATARQAADAEGDVESEGTRGDHLDGGTVIIPQAHDGALTELLVDLRQGDFERLVSIIGDGLCRGCFTGCHGDPFVCGLSGLRVSWPG